MRDETPGFDHVRVEVGYHGDNDDGTVKVDIKADSAQDDQVAAAVAAVHALFHDLK